MNGDPSIVETSARDARELAVVEPCRLELGRVDSDPATTFDGIRGAHLLSGGRLVVFDGGSREVRYFDRTGAHLATVGGEGEGPGEFLEFTSVAPFGGDSLGVLDRRTRRITVLGGSGEIARTRSLADLSSLYEARLLGRIGPSTAILTRTPIRPEPRQREYFRDTVMVRLIHPDTAAVDTLLVAPGREWYYPNMDAGEFAFGPGYQISFGFDLHVAVAGDELVHGDGRSFALTRLDPAAGTERGILRTDRPPQPLDGPLVEEHLRSTRERLGEGMLMDAVEGQLDVLPPGHTVPAFSDLRSTGARMMVRDFIVPGIPAADRTERWSIFEPDGTLTEMFTTPAGFALLDLTGDAVVGRRRTELGVQYLQVCDVQSAR